MSDDELAIFTGLDQSIPASIDVLQKVDQEIENAICNKDLDAAMSVAIKLVNAAKVSGLGLARVLFKLYERWEDFETGDEFTDTISSYLGLHPHTIDRYVKVQMMLNVSPVRSELEQHNIKDLIPIANAVAQGYEIENDQWEKMADAPDYATVAQIVRDEIKNKEPRKSSLQLHLDREGTIWAFVDQERFFVGSLEVSAQEPEIKQAIQRIKTSAGMLEE